MSIKEIIEARSIDLSTAANAPDPETAAAIYTDDAWLMVSGGLIVKGRAAILQFWRDSTAAGVSDYAYHNLEAYEFGNLAIDINSLIFSVLNADGSRTKLTGKAMIVWKNDSGIWKIFRDIWNLDAS
jgi:ketosteroid isomerase-like protein